MDNRKEKNQLEELEYNINIWQKIIKQQEQYILQDTDQFPHAWTEYVNAKTQLKRIAKRYGTIEPYAIKDLFR